MRFITATNVPFLFVSGVDALSYDSNKIALDYHSIGFRECSAEVARYLVAVEGLDLQDPLRLRLLSHLQCYVAQHHHKATSSWVSWGSAGSSTAAPSPSYGHGVTGFQGPSMLTPPHHSGPTHNHLDQSHMSAFTAPSHSNNTSADLSCGLPTVGGITPHVPQITSQRLPTTGSGPPHLPPVSMATASSQPYHSTYHLNLNAFPATNGQNTAISSSSNNISNIPTSNISSNVSSNLTTLTTNHGHHSSNLSLPTNHGPHLSSLSANHSALHYNAGTLHGAPSDSKPYRPWGAEIAY